MLCVSAFAVFAVCGIDGFTSALLACRYLVLFIMILALLSAAAVALATIFHMGAGTVIVNVMEAFLNANTICFTMKLASLSAGSTVCIAYLASITVLCGCDEKAVPVAWQCLENAAAEEEALGILCACGDGTHSTRTSGSQACLSNLI